MSRYYSMDVEIRGFDPKRTEAIIAAIGPEWEWEEGAGVPEWDKRTIYAHGNSNLYGGETEEDFAERLSIAAWKANRKFCRVGVVATYLENLPYEKHQLLRGDYERLMKPKRKRR